VAWSLARLRHRPGTLWLEDYCEEARRRLPQLPPQQVLFVIVALASFVVKVAVGCSIDQIHNTCMRGLVLDSFAYLFSALGLVAWSPELEQINLLHLHIYLLHLAWLVAWAPELEQRPL